MYRPWIHPRRKREMRKNDGADDAAAADVYVFVILPLMVILCGN